jgi:hypothetical protein
MSTKQNFWLTFPAVIVAISNPEFVWFDLEMTGVKTRTHGWTESHMQHIYQQVKAADQIFNILQVGISCVCYDEDERGKLHQTAADSLWCTLANCI